MWINSTEKYISSFEKMEKMATAAAAGAAEQKRINVSLDFSFCVYAYVRNKWLLCYHCGVHTVVSLAN